MADNDSDNGDALQESRETSSGASHESNASSPIRRTESFDPQDAELNQELATDATMGATGEVVAPLLSGDAEGMMDATMGATGEVVAPLLSGDAEGMMDATMGATGEVTAPLLSGDTDGMMDATMGATGELVVSRLGLDGGSFDDLDEQTLQGEVDLQTGEVILATPGGTPTTGDMRSELDERIRQRIAKSEAAEAVDPLIGRVIAERFHIESKVGEGGMGAVYRARQKGMDRAVAIKVLLGELSRNETVVRRFHLEALAVSKLRHPNTIQIFDFGETEDGILYIAMEFLEGASLHEVLAKERVLSVRRALKIAEQMAKSLREAHAKGIVHRDLKPDNVFLCTVGEEVDFVKVLDFGVAKLRDGDTPGKDLTKTGTIFGTPKYMSPEQAKAGIVDARSDLYAIGIILYEMVTGRAPFHGDNSLGILIQHIQDQIPLLEDIQPDLAYPQPAIDLIYRLLEKNPDARPQSAEALIRQCANITENLEDIYRNVLTRKEAVDIGLDLAMSPRTRADTEFDAESARGAVTEGPFRDETIIVSPDPVRQGTGGLKLAVAALLLAMSVFGALWMNVATLPTEVIGFERIAEMERQAIPELRIQQVSIGITTQPAGVVVKGSETAIANTAAFNLVRPLNAKAVTLTFEKEGFKPLTHTFAFNEPSPPPVGIQLVRVEDTTESVVKVRTRKPRPKASSPAPRVKQDKPAAASTSVESAPQQRAKPKPPTKLKRPGKLSKLKSTKLKSTKLKPTKLKPKGGLK